MNMNINIINKTKELASLNFFKPWMMTADQAKAASQIEKDILLDLLIHYRDDNKLDLKYAKAYQQYVSKAKAYNNSVRRNLHIKAQKRLGTECKDAFIEFRSLIHRANEGMSV